MLYSHDHQRSIGAPVQPELFHNALMASRYAMPSKRNSRPRPGKPGMNSLDLCCELLRLGCSHTVVSWLATDGQQGQASQQLRAAAATGKCQSLNVCLDSCLAA